MGGHMPDYQAAFLNKAVPMRIMDDDKSLRFVNRAMTDYSRDVASNRDEIFRLFSTGADETRLHTAGDATGDVTGDATASARLCMAREYIEIAEEGAGIGFWNILVKEKACSVDRGWAHLIGYEAEELGGSFEEVFMHRVHPTDQPMVAAHVLCLDDGTRPVGRAEFRMQHRDGRWIWVRSVCRVVAYDAEGAPERVAGMHIDTTQEHEIGEALAEAKKKIILLSSVTRHDILNQVSVILMCDELVRGNIGRTPMTPEKADHYWDMASTAAHTIERLISFTRDYDALGMEPPRWQNLATVVRNAEILLHGTGVVVTLTCGEIEVFADPLFEKVIYNLLENVQRHSDGASQVTITFTEDEERGVLTISDDGCGVPQNKKNRIFERGYGTNTGLGLYLSREMLGITGITICECGTFGVGAVFRLDIPLNHIRRGKNPV